MKKYTYSLIALSVAVLPLAFSFESRLHFWTHWPALFAATFVVGVFFVIGDVLVVHSGHWEFNPEWTGKLRIWGLPVGGYLFFLTVPYAMIFVYEAFRTLWSDRVLFDGSPSQLFTTAALLVAAAAVWRRQGYTLLALLTAAVFLTTTGLQRPALVGTQSFWLYMALGFAAFGLVNGIHTTLPTIYHDPKTIWGFRLGTIPLEDFFYNLSYLGLLLDFYLTFERLIPPL